MTFKEDLEKIHLDALKSVVSVDEAYRLLLDAISYHCVIKYALSDDDFLDQYEEKLYQIKNEFIKTLIIYKGCLENSFWM